MFLWFGIYTVYIGSPATPRRPPRLAPRDTKTFWMISSHSSASWVHQQRDLTQNPGQGWFTYESPIHFSAWDLTDNLMLIGPEGHQMLGNHPEPRCIHREPSWGRQSTDIYCIYMLIHKNTHNSGFYNNRLHISISIYIFFEIFENSQHLISIYIYRFAAAGGNF